MTAKRKSTVIDDAKINEVLASVPITDLSYKDMAMKPADHQFLVRLMNMRDEDTEDRILGKVKSIMLRDNETLCKNVVNLVSLQLGETLVPIFNKLSELADGQKSIALDISDIKLRLDQMEDKVESDERIIADVVKRLNKKKERIDVLEKQMKLLNPDVIKKFIEEIEAFRPCMEKMIRVNSVSNIILRMIIGIVVGVGFVWVALKWVWNLI